MPTPIDSSQDTMWHSILAAIAAMFLALGAKLLNRSGKQPRPDPAKSCDHSEITMALERLTKASEAVTRQMGHQTTLIENIDQRLYVLEVARDHPRGIPHTAG